MLGLSRRLRGAGGGGVVGAPPEEEGGEEPTSPGTLVAGAGSNAWGNFGAGYESGNVPTFVEGVEFLSGGTLKKVQIVGGGSAALALMTNGDVWGAGGNNYGSLCDGTFVNKSRPVKTLLKNVQDFELGGSAGIAKHFDGSISTWGGNGEGQCGDGRSTAGSETGGRFVAHTSPFELYAAGSGVVAIASSASNAGVVFSDGSVAMWGENRNGQVGNNTEDKSANGETPVTEPVVIWTPSSEGEHAVELQIGTATKGSGHVLMRRKDGRLMAWGTKRHGECAIEPFNGVNLLVPTLVPNEAGGVPIPGLVNVAQIVAGAQVAFTINTAKELYFFGLDVNWGSGLGYLIPEPTRAAQIAASSAAVVIQEEWRTVVFPPRKVHDNVVHAAFEESCVAVVTVAGELLTAGKNAFQQLGRGEPLDQAIVEGHAAVPSLAAAPGVTGAVEASVSIYNIVCRCGHAAAPIFSIAAKKRALKASWVSAIGSPWKVVVQLRGQASEEELSEEEELETAAQFTRRTPLFVKPGSDATGSNLTVTPSGTFTEAVDKQATPLTGLPTASPSIADSTPGHRAEALLDLSTPAAAALLAELATGNALIKDVKFKWHGNPKLGKPKLGLKYTAKAKPESTSLKFGENELRWYATKLTNAQKAQFVEGGVLASAHVFAETGTEAWTADEIYVQVETEWTPDRFTVAEGVRTYTATQWRGKNLEPGDLYSIKIEGGPTGWLKPLSFATVQGVRAIAAVKTKRGTSGTITVEAFGENAVGAYSISGQPAGVTINKDTGVISYSITAGVGWGAIKWGLFSWSTSVTQTVTVTVKGQDEEGVAWTDAVSFPWTLE